MTRTASIVAFAALALSPPAFGDPPPATTSGRGAPPAIPRSSAEGSNAPSAPAVSGAPIAADPFARLQRVVEPSALGPIRSVRLHDRQQTLERSRKEKIRVQIQTRPSGAVVKWGRKTLGTTPVTLVAPRDSTPADLVIRRSGYMVLRTRVQRRISRTYFFKLTPAKFH